MILAITKTNYSQIGMGKWKIHTPTKKGIDLALNDQEVYVALESGLVKLEISNINEPKILDVMNGLSDISISCLYFDETDNSLFIGYENGNIDKLKNEVTCNIPAVKLANIASSKKVNRFFRIGDYVYAATDFAIIKLNTTKNEVKDTYYPTNENEKITDISNIGDTILALTPTRLLKGTIGNLALSSPSEWTVDKRLSILNNHEYKEIEVINDKIFVLFKHPDYGKDSLFVLSNNQKTLVSVSDYSLEINSINLIDDQNIAVNCRDAVIIYNGNDFSVMNNYNGTINGINLSVSRSGKNSEGIWFSDENNCLYLFTSEYNFKNFVLNGPKNNFFYSMDSHKNKVAIASGYLNSKAPAFSKNGIHFIEDNSWSFANFYDQPCWQGKNVWDMLDIAINPKRPTEYAVCTPSEVPVTVFNNNCVVYDSSNSTLEISSAGSGWYWLSDVSYDEYGNLWALNGFCEKPLNVRNKNGNWKNFDCGFQARNKFTQKMIIDFDNIIWFSVLDEGLFGYNHNGTIDDESDDQYKQITSGSFTGDLPSSNVTAIAADFNGEIWIGTDAGFAILYNAANVFNANSGEYNAQRIKINFEGNVEYLLGSTHITDIEVDGGNRKWMATANAGLILLSADGNEILENLTTENSPLISNIIYDIKLNQETGELFIITDKGLVSYRTDASYEDPEYSNTKVFPNPVRPTYFGPVTIQGIRYDSDVKITDVAGNLVYKTTSNGGTATWDCKTLSGQKVASGIYFIWTATNEGNDKKVGKVLVIN
jgi:hypothetical protein